MKFTKIVAVVAILSVAGQAFAANSGGTLRREMNVGQIQAAPQEQTITVQTVQKPVAQPVTVVEAAPAVDSRADSLRKARQGAEVQTEQKIVEKLEESRLQEEQDRAKRLFGEEGDEAPAAAATVPAAPATVPAATSSAVAAPNSGVVIPVTQPAAQPAQPAQPAQTPAQVTIQKIEIVQPAQHAPAPAAPAVAPVVAPAPIAEEKKAPVAESLMDMNDVDKEDVPDKTFYVTGLVGTVNYNASNVRSNGALGVGAGAFLRGNWAVEGSYLYSSHQIDTFWQPNIYRDMDQHDIQAATKYYFTFNNLKPYVGAALTYTIRKYSDRMVNNSAWWVNPYTTHEETQALSLGLLGGADFQMAKNFLIGGGIEYNTNISNSNSFVFSNYGLPPNTQALEEMDFITLKLNAKLTF